MTPLVWLPFDPEVLGDPPPGLRYEVVDPTVEVPDSVAEVVFYVPPYQVGPRPAEVIDRMSSLQVVQTLTAGVDNVRDRIPAGVTLCNGRGIHDASTIVPLTSETRGLVDASFLARMKDGALLVNVARGPVVVTDDLVAALGTGAIAAAIDVVDPEPLPADHPLWKAPNLLISPHVGGASSAMWPRAYRLVRDQLHRFAAGEPLANVMAGEY